KLSLADQVVREKDFLNNRAWSGLDRGRLSLCFPRGRDLRDYRLEFFSPTGLAIELGRRDHLIEEIFEVDPDLLQSFQRAVEVKAQRGPSQIRLSQIVNGIVVAVRSFGCYCLKPAHPCLGRLRQRLTDDQVDAGGILLRNGGYGTL